MPNYLPNLFLTAARQTLAEGLHKIEHCVAQLTDDQIWWRPRSASAAAKNDAATEMNSIANLMLHLAGNVRQWIIAGIGRAKDIRNRPLEFADRSRRPKADVLAQLQSTVKEADAVIALLSANELIENRRIQGFDTNVTAALFGTISHFRGHVQEIIHITRQQLGDKYKFDFVPQGPEQISASPSIP